MDNTATRVLKLLDEHEQYDDVWWSCKGEYAPITFFVNCNDLFYWACSDAVIITDKNIELLESSYIEASKHENECGECYASLLFCCRDREMQPQGAYYKDIPKSMWPLFDSCGPDRSEEKGNTKKPLTN
jgi:hypothetical protein